MGSNIFTLQSDAPGKGGSGFSDGPRSPSLSYTHAAPTQQGAWVPSRESKLNADPQMALEAMLTCSCSCAFQSPGLPCGHSDNPPGGTQAEVRHRGSKAETSDPTSSSHRGPGTRAEPTRSPVHRSSLGGAWAARDQVVSCVSCGC